MLSGSCCTCRECTCLQNPPSQLSPLSLFKFEDSSVISAELKLVSIWHGVPSICQRVLTAARNPNNACWLSLLRYGFCLMQGVFLGWVIRGYALTLSLFFDLLFFRRTTLCSVRAHRRTVTSSWAVSLMWNAVTFQERGWPRRNTLRKTFQRDCRLEAKKREVLKQVSWQGLGFWTKCQILYSAVWGDMDNANAGILFLMWISI